MQTKLQSPNIIRKVSIALIVIFILVILSEGYFPDEDNDGWSNPPIAHYLLVIGIGVCMAIIGATYTYNSWRLDAKHFWRWFYQSLSTRPPKQWINKASESSGHLGHWFFRLLSPVFILGGIAIIGSMFVKLINFFFG